MRADRALAAYGADRALAAYWALRADRALAAYGADRALAAYGALRADRALTAYEALGANRSLNPRRPRSSWIAGWTLCPSAPPYEIEALDPLAGPWGLSDPLGR